MGVRGLQTFVESFPDIFRLVDIAQMVADYRESHPDADSKPVIVVDGNNSLHQGLGQKFCENQLDWICGGQWDEYLKALGDFMEAFDKIGVKLVFFFDGLTHNLIKWVSRCHRNVADIKEIFQKIKTTPYLPVASNTYTVASILSYALRASLKYVFHATVYCTASGECDHALASFAVKHQCMAIMAQDTDYIIYPTAPYLSMEHLDIKTMHTRIYCREALCRELEMKEWMLPLFACMVGTGEVTKPSLTKFHKTICANKSIKGLHRIHTIVRCVAEYINTNFANYQDELLQCIPEIYEHIGLGQKNAITLDTFKKAVEFYLLDPTEIGEFLDPTTNYLNNEGDESVYDTLLRKVKNGELLPTILNIICSGRYMFSPSLEDASADKKLPPCVLVYRPLRQRMYGLIFELKDNNFEKGMLVPHTGELLPIENTVDEWWINPSETSKDKNKDAVMPLSVEFSDGISSATVLYDIIMEKDENLLEKKWAVFKACLGLTISDSTFQCLPHQYKSLCAILNYLIQKPDVPINLWEVEAFLVQAVHPKFEDNKNHMQLQLMPYNPRAVHLATLFLRGADILFDLLWFCGNPVEMEYFLPWKFFNGKFFHHIYKGMLMSEGGRVDLSDDHLEKFKLLKETTLEGINLQECFQ